MKKSRRLDARSARSGCFVPSFDPTPTGWHRQARLQHILITEIQSLLRDEAADPALAAVQLLSAELSPDGGHVRLAYVVEAPLAQERDVRRTTRAALERATGFLRARLAAQLDLKHLPKLSFTFVGVVEGGAPWPE